MRRHFASGFPRALLSLSQQRNPLGLRLICIVNVKKNLPKARFKRRILHVPNLMQMNENNRLFSFALDSVYVKCDVSNGPKY